MTGATGLHSIYLDRAVSTEDCVGFTIDQRGNRCQTSRIAIIEYLPVTFPEVPLFRFTGEVPRKGEELHIYGDTRVFVVRIVEWLMLHGDGPCAATVRVVNKAQMDAVVGARRYVEKTKEKP